MRLSIKATALTCAILCGFGLFFLTWWIILFEGASAGPTFIGKVYRGYSLTPVGSFLGLVWGFVDGLIGGVIIAWLYNSLLGRQSTP